MSQRTIVEFNHDYAHELGKCEELHTLLRRAMGSGSKEEWRPLERLGIKRVIQLHHSDERKVVTKFGEYPL